MLQIETKLAGPAGLKSDRPPGLRQKEKGRFSGMSQKSTFGALGEQVDYVEVGVALGDDVSAAKDAGR